MNSPDSPVLVLGDKSDWLTDDGDVKPAADGPDNYELYEPYAGDRFDDDPTSTSHSLETGMQLVQIETFAAAKHRVTMQLLSKPALVGEITRPYDELGGGIHTAQPERASLAHQLDEIVHDSEGWYVDVVRAVERYGLNQVNEQILANTKCDEKQKYLFHVVRFMQSVQAHAKMIRSVDGDISLASNSHVLGVDLHAHATQDMMRYAATLEELVGVLKEAGFVEMAENMHKKTGIKKPFDECLKRLKPDEYQVEFHSDSAGKTKLRQKKER